MSFMARMFSTIPLRVPRLSRCFASLLALLCLISTPVSSVTFTINGNGTVTDPTTGLMWMRCSMGQTWTGSTCTGTAKTYSWDQANALTGTTGYAGSGDWRLPSLHELLTIVDWSTRNPTIDATAFPKTPNSSLFGFWTAATYPSDSGAAWYIDFGYGEATNANKNYANNVVRLVRGLSLLNEARLTSDYVDHGNGTVTDIPTGLMWKRCAEGQTWTGTTCAGTATKMRSAQAIAATSTFVGKTDWRLPTLAELWSLVDFTKNSPAINEAIFPATSAVAVVWSASSSPGLFSSFMSVDFSYGIPTISGSSEQVRFVRAGQPPGSSTTATTTTPQTGSSGTLNFVAGWNLAGHGSASGALDVVVAFGDAAKVSTVWKWNVGSAKWAFYAPTLVGQALTDYAISKGYDVLTTVNGGEGFWVNAKTTFTANLASSCIP